MALSLIPQILLVKWLGSYPQWIENYYSLGFYAHISRIMRQLYGWLPISLGDIAYTGLFLILVFLVYRRWREIRKKPLSVFRDLAAVLAVAYASFNLLWGFNYYRIPLNETLNFEPRYADSELMALTADLILTTNALQFRLTGDRNAAVQMPYQGRDIYRQTIEAYNTLQDTWPQFRYPVPSLKPSLLSTVLTYMGYSGYLNPFTNEAQVNRLIPAFRLPVVSAHEIAHQLGYSAENEANFIGYLATSNHNDPYYRYSASAYALGYCLNEINRRDPPTYHLMISSLNPGVLANYAELQTFWEEYKNPAEPLFKEMFSTFLKANNQRDGIASYSRVVALLIGYHREYPLSDNEIDPSPSP